MESGWKFHPPVVQFWVIAGTIRLRLLAVSLLTMLVNWPGVVSLQLAVGLMRSTIPTFTIIDCLADLL
jgi:hypothetical protein